MKYILSIKAWLFEKINYWMIYLLRLDGHKASK